MYPPPFPQSILSSQFALTFAPTCSMEEERLRQEAADEEARQGRLQEALRREAEEEAEFVAKAEQAKARAEEKRREFEEQARLRELARQDAAMAAMRVEAEKQAALEATPEQMELRRVEDEKQRAREERKARVAAIMNKVKKGKDARVAAATVQADAAATPLPSATHSVTSADAADAEAAGGMMSAAAPPQRCDPAWKAVEDLIMSEGEGEGEDAGISETTVADQALWQPVLQAMMAQ